MERRTKNLILTELRPQAVWPPQPQIITFDENIANYISFQGHMMSKLCLKFNGVGSLRLLARGQLMTQQGAFEQGLLQGEGIITYENGNKLYSNFVNGVPNGLSQLKTADGSLLWEGYYQNGRVIE